MQSISGAIHHATHRVERIIHSRSVDFWWFEASVWAHVVGSSLISVFIPILMLEAGYSLQAVLGFFVLFHIISALSSFAARPFIRKYDARASITLATIFFILFFIAYSFVGETRYVGQLLLLGILAGLYDGFYYVPLLYIFIGANKKAENTGENTGILNLVIRSAALIGPSVGSIILLGTGSNIILLGAAIVILLLSLVPLYKIKNIETKPETNPPKFKEFFKDPRERKNYLSLILFKVHETAEHVLWPIFIFVVFETVESVAGLAILVSFTALIFSYLAGLIKKGQRERVIMAGAILLAVVWILRIFISHPIFLYGTVIFTALFALLVKIPIEANVFRRGHDHAPLTSSMYKNALGMGTKSIFYVFAFFAVGMFEISFALVSILLLLVAASNADYLYWRKKHGMPLTEAEGRTTEGMRVG